MDFFRSFFKSNKVPKYPVTTDIHSHLLPGVDDGVKSKEESIAFLREMNNWGISKFVFTPHISGRYPLNTEQSLKEKFEEFQKDVSKAGLNVTLHLAAEYMLDDRLKQSLRDKTKFLTIGNSHILLEFPLHHLPAFAHELIFQIQCEGYEVILAHPERYSYFWSDNEKLLALKDRNILFQLNLLSMAGVYGSQVKKAAIQLVKGKNVDLVGSDLHHENHLKVLEKLNNTKHILMLHSLSLKNNGFSV